jgi:hypothetical protein
MGGGEGHGGPDKLRLVGRRILGCPISWVQGGGGVSKAGDPPTLVGRTAVTWENGACFGVIRFMGGGGWEEGHGGPDKLRLVGRRILGCPISCVRGGGGGVSKAGDPPTLVGRTRYPPK